MSGTWPLARAAVKAKIDGAQVTVSGHAQETLDALEYAPGGRQDVNEWPYAFLLPAGRNYRHEPGMQRLIGGSIAVRVMLAPKGNFGSMESLHQRYDAWVDKLADLFDDALQLDGTCDSWEEQEFGGLAFFDAAEVGWGFDMTFTGLVISETKTPGA